MTLEERNHPGSPESPQVPMPARLLALAEEFASFHDDLQLLRVGEHLSREIAEALATQAGSSPGTSRTYQKAAGRIHLPLSPVAGDVHIRLTLLAPQAATAADDLRIAESLLRILSTEEMAQGPGGRTEHVQDTLIEAGRHVAAARTLTALGAPDLVVAADDLTGAVRARHGAEPAASMSSSQYRCLMAIAQGYVSVVAQAVEEAWLRYDRLSMATVRSLEARGWVTRAPRPLGTSLSVRLYLTDAGRVALASRLGRPPAPASKRPAPLAAQAARTRLRCPKDRCDGAAAEPPRLA
ncbi:MULTISPECIES: hypothetical protein [unclassified Streptomyces]|uniref:hypothetical protein n=1 Tax=unclassified Streptomyces TaxID=2593676 RepID=UPI0029669F32|nr:hypothetical protein [Streptomyces sp. SJL17-1]